MWMTGCGVLRVAEHVHQPLHVLERGMRVAIGDDRFEVDVLVEVPQRGSEIHPSDPDGALRTRRGGDAAGGGLRARDERGVDLLEHRRRGR